MMEWFYRLSAQVGVRASKSGLFFFVDLEDEPVRSHLLPWKLVRPFLRWCQLHAQDYQEGQTPFSRRLDEACGGPYNRKNQELGRCLGISPNTVCHWRHGRALPSQEQAIQIARFFGWNPQETILDLMEEVWQHTLRKKRKIRKERSLMKTTKTFLTSLLILVVLAVVLSPGRGLYVIADSNCVPEIYDPNASPFPLDPNQIVGFLLPPMEVFAGKFNRVGRYCDPEDDPISITIPDNPWSLQVDVNDLSKEWRLVGDLTIGVYYVVLQVADHPLYAIPAEAYYTLVIKAVAQPNEPPAVY